MVVPRLLDQYQLHYSRRLLEKVVNYQYIDSVPPGSQQLLVASFTKVRRERTPSTKNTLFDSICSTCKARACGLLLHVLTL